MIMWSLITEMLFLKNPETTEGGIPYTLKDILTYLYCTKCYSLKDIEKCTDSMCSAITLRLKMIELGIPMKSRGGCNNKKNIVITEEEYKTHLYKELAFKYKVHPTTIKNKCREWINKGGKKRKN